MACPYFLPTVICGGDQWICPPRLPLGEPCAGLCKANGDDFEPGATTLQKFCNRGYGRYGCGRMPAGARADALRFSLASDAAGVLAIQYVYERDYAPEAHGVLEFDVAGEQWRNPPGDPLLAAQGRMFALSYLRKRRNAA